MAMFADAMPNFDQHMRNINTKWTGSDVHNKAMEEVYMLWLLYIIIIIHYKLLK